MRKFKNIIFNLILTILVLFVSHEVLAAEIEIANIQTGTGGGGGNEYSTTIKGTDGTTYTCKYEMIYNDYRIVTVDTYDKENKELTKAKLEIDEQDAILAGTSIGILVYETKYVDVSANFSVKKTTTTTTYNHKKTCNCCPRKSESSVCNPNDNFCNYLNDITLSPRIKLLGNVLKCQKKTSSCSTISESATCTPKNPCSSSEIASNCKETIEESTTTETEEVTNPNNEGVIKCKEKIHTAMYNHFNYILVNENRRYTLYLNDSNDYNAINDKNDESKRIQGVSITTNETTRDEYLAGYELTRKDGCNDKDELCFVYSHTPDVKNDEFAELILEYRPETVCMNVKTAEVRYLKVGSGESCGKDEIQILDDTIDSDPSDGIDCNDANNSYRCTHWHYFIPLNTKSSNDISLWMYNAETSEKYEPKECKNTIDNYLPTSNIKYWQVMVDGDGNEFEAAKKGATKKELDDLVRNAKKTVDKTGGCYLQSVIKIPTKQRFYNEVETDDNSGNKTVKFNGFNFYYRPIDTENPFPNGITSGTTSLWTEYNNLGSLPNLDLSESFDNVTYVAENINPSSIRKYNKNNLYTSWSNMNIDGTSKYIDDENVIKRVKKGNIYKLGCGPINEMEYLDDAKTIKNVYYQPECVK